MNENLDQLDDLQVKQELPVFLKVLCILTFVGSGLAILGAIVSFLLMDFSMRVVETSPLYRGLEMDVEAMMRWSKYANLANLLGGALCLTGALLMWKLKKSGFAVYVVGATIPVIVSFIAAGYVMNGPFEGWGYIGSILGVLISAAFIVMYGVNYKHLR